MSTRLGLVVRVACLAVLVAGFQATTLGQGLAELQPPASIELQGVPDPLILPGPPGSNRMLTAVLRGGEASRVWLSPSCEREGPPLAHVDFGRWQINLDEKRLAEFLAKEGPDQGFRICALVNDRIVESVGLTYRLDASAGEFPFPWDRATVTVKQRSTKDLAGGQLRITLDDVTAGQVLLTLTGAEEQSIIDTCSVVEG